VTAVLAPKSLTGKRALVTGSSRGIGAATVTYLAEAGASVVVNYRNKEARAAKLVAELVAAGSNAIALGADLTDPESRERMFSEIRSTFGGLDILILNASGGMESAMAADYAMTLNRDAQVAVLRGALSLLSPGARVVFVTSHQAHFIRTTPTMPEYEAVAVSKRAGEDALRALVPELAAQEVEFVVVSGDMINGTITATLLERASPGALNARKTATGHLYSVTEFAAEVALAVSEPVPSDHTKLVGNVSGFISDLS
jgi:3-oxoacyl-[acyl-carrier protein] reductase